MRNSDIPEVLVAFVAIGLLCTASVGHAGLFDEVRGAIDSVREGTDTVKDAKKATQDAKDLLPEVEAEKPTPSVKAQPPALPNAAQWHVSIDGQSAGPFATSKIGSLISQGKVTRESLVWKEGMGNWVPADSVKEISGLFRATPPPLPPN